MAIENFGTIAQLVASQPFNTDLLSEGDDHIRGIKATLKNTFPQINSVVEMSSQKMNALNDSFVMGVGKGLHVKGDFSLRDGANFFNLEAKSAIVHDLNPTGANSLITKHFADSKYATITSVTGSLSSLTQLVYGSGKIVKIKTTSDGVDVTGTTHTDKLDVQGDATVSGKVDIGTKLTVGNGLDVNKGSVNVKAGSVTATGLHSTGAISFASTCTRTSDERLKTNIEPLDKGTEDIEPVKYLKGGNYEYGVIAQQVQPIIPHAVIEEAGGYLGVDYNNLIPMLIWDIKQLKERLRALEGE